MSDRAERARQYAERAARFSREAERLGGRSRLISNLRGLSFAAAVVPAAFVVFGGAAPSTALASVAALALFAALVVLHARVIDAQDEALRWKHVNESAHARMTGKWRDLPDDGASLVRADHPYSGDLDVFGRGSLFQRICTARTSFGQAQLARLLGEPCGVPEARLRQEAVRSLLPMLETRQQLEALGLALGGPADGQRAPRPAPSPEPLLSWAESAPTLGPRVGIVWAARALPPVTLAAMAASFLLGLPSWTWLAPLLAQVALVWSTRAETTAVFTAVSSGERGFVRYGPMLELLERCDVPSELVAGLREKTRSGSTLPSAAMRDFQRRLSWFELRHNGLVHPFAAALLLWDIHCVVRLEAWQVASGKAVREWFAALGTFEALAALSTFAHDEPDFVWPELEDGAARFEAERLGHPLVAAEARVDNDVALAGAGTALLVTGSNMSGKSTMLRTMGLAVVLAFAGAPVCARRFRVSALRLGTSIRVSDSLERGVSHFYAEVRKIRDVLAATESGVPVLFLLDEILHGTNSRERQMGARWVLAELLRRGALGAVSTHDLELCRLEGDLEGRVRQVHFRETVSGDAMTFDYLLREGPVAAGNALRLMRQLGIQVPLD